MTTIDELRSAAKAANQKLSEAETAIRVKENASLLARCFRYRNNYSCPEKDSDYWWMYAKVIKIAKDGRLTLFQFQIDRYGNFDCRPAEDVFRITDGYQPLSAKKFNAAWKHFASKMLNAGEDAEDVRQ